MKFQFTKNHLTQLDTDLAVVQVFSTEDKKIVLQKSDGGAEIDQALQGGLSALLIKKGFSGKLGESYVVPSFGKIKPRMILVLGAGPKKSFSLEVLRQNAGTMVSVAKEYKAATIAGVMESASIGSFASAERLRAFAEGSTMASYTFDLYKTEDRKQKAEDRKIEPIFYLVATGNTKPLQTAAEQGSTVGHAVNLARTLTDLPPNILTPTELGKWAQKHCHAKNVTCKVMGLKEIKAEKMGGILAVSQGSAEPPSFIHLHYKPAKKSKTSIALVGKGITFDSGGLNIKLREMEAMKMDMAGSASVVGVFSVLAALKPNFEVHGFIASSENMPSSNAVRPSDIITMRSGKTVEVLNTDAEGRLVLADALDYALQFKPSFIVDAATLTGGTLYALGEKCTSILGNNDGWIKKIIKAGKKAGEPAWQLPLIQDYKRAFKKGPADLTNIGTTKASTISGALFLEEFVKETPWAHMDIAGTAWVTDCSGYFSKGATGVPARTFIYFLMGW